MLKIAIIPEKACKIKIIIDLTDTSWFLIQYSKIITNDNIHQL